MVIFFIFFYVRGGFWVRMVVAEVGEGFNFG